MRTSILIASMALTLAITGCTSIPTRESVAPAASADSSAPSAASQQVLENGTVVDDIRLGMATECGGPDCATRMKLATAEAISRHGLASSAIGAAHFYMPYIPPGTTLGTGGGLIVVFEIDDGSQAAIYTFCFDSCFVVNAQPVPPLTLPSPEDHGPLVDPLVEAPRDCSTPDHPACNGALRVAIDEATTNGFISPATIADTHYYIDYIAAGSPEAAAFKAEYIVHLYIPGDHDNLAETAIGVFCGSGPCQTVSLPK